MVLSFHCFQTGWKVRILAYEAHKCQGYVCRVKLLEMRTQIRMATRTKFQMLPVVHECCLKLQTKTFQQFFACARTFRSVLFSRTMI